jgi:hypothetical protein
MSWRKRKDSFQGDPDAKEKADTLDIHVSDAASPFMS